MKASAKPIDVLGLGCVAVDDLLYVPSFPAVDAKVQVEQGLRRCGGLTGAALVTAARLGARCAYAGCLGTDELSQYVAEDFAREGISTAQAPRLPEARVVRAVIIVGRDTGSRNIFFQSDGRIGAHDSLPPEEVIRQAKVLFIDHCGMPGNLRAARVARGDGVAVVADFEDAAAPCFEEVLGLADHLILSEAFALGLTGEPNAAQAALALWRPDRAAVIITCGANGCWGLAEQGQRAARHFPAFPVKVADTTGCGDVFHGAYAARLVCGEPLAERIRFAAAAAALKAMQSEIPRLAAVEGFLGRNSVL
ncbi:MAG: PfkB family carbohydrate kinase [Verrucomicrobiota bacterium]